MRKYDVSFITAKRQCKTITKYERCSRSGFDIKNINGVMAAWKK